MIPDLTKWATNYIKLPVNGYVTRHTSTSRAPPRWPGLPRKNWRASAVLWRPIWSNERALLDRRWAAPSLLPDSLLAYRWLSAVNSKPSARNQKSWVPKPRLSRSASGRRCSGWEGVPPVL